MKFNFLFVLGFILIACQENDSINSEENENQIVQNDSISEAYSAQFIGLLNSGEEISSELAELFIRPALIEQPIYVYSTDPSFRYTYGELVLENDSFFVFTFSIEGEDGLNMLDAEFIASFNKHTDAFIDSRLIGSHSDFEGHSSIGYNTGTEIKYNINLVEEKDLIIRVDCKLKDVFYNFNTKKTGKAKDSEEVQISSFEVHVQTNGEMFDSLED